MFFVTAILNKIQFNTLSEVVKLQSITELDDDKLVAAGLCTQKQIIDLKEHFDPYAKEWRGRYQAISKAIVTACDAALQNVPEPQ